MQPKTFPVDDDVATKNTFGGVVQNLSFWSAMSVAKWVLKRVIMNSLEKSWFAEKETDFSRPLIDTPKNVSILVTFTWPKKGTRYRYLYFVMKSIDTVTVTLSRNLFLYNFHKGPLLNKS